MSKRRNIELLAIAIFVLVGMLLLLLVACIAIKEIGLSRFFDFLKIIVPLLTLGAAVVTCILASWIPFRIMQNQIYTDLMHEYRSECMLENIDKIIRICGYHGKYREKDCIEDCQVLHKCRRLQNCEKDEDKKDRIEKEIFFIQKSTWQTVSQWYWQLANLLFTEKYFGNTREIKKLTRKNFTKHDSDIICIIYHLNHGLDKYYYNRKFDSKFTKLLKKLFRESEYWEDDY